MMNFIARVIICFSCLFFITACFHRIPNSPCAVTCEDRYQTCNKLCRNNCPQCTAAAGQMRDRTYNHYIYQQYVQGGLIALQLNSFRDPLQCRKVTCSCRDDYKICLASCGRGGIGDGVIQKCLKNAPLCS